MWHRLVYAVRTLFGGPKAYQEICERARAANGANARNNELASRVEFKTLEEKLHSLLDELLKTQEQSPSKETTALPGRVGLTEIHSLGWNVRILNLRGFRRRHQGIDARRDQAGQGHAAGLPDRRG